jgi:hypothetical protein
MHALPYAALTKIGEGEPARLETPADAGQAMDRIAAGTRPYLAGEHLHDGPNTPA